MAVLNVLRLGRFFFIFRFVFILSHFYGTGGTAYAVNENRTENAKCRGNCRVAVGASMPRSARSGVPRTYSCIRVFCVRMYSRAGSRRYGVRMRDRASDFSRRTVRCRAHSMRASIVCWLLTGRVREFYVSLYVVCTPFSYALLTVYYTIRFLIFLLAVLNSTNGR